MYDVETIQRKIWGLQNPRSIELKKRLEEKDIAGFYEILYGINLTCPNCGRKITEIREYRKESEIIAKSREHNINPPDMDMRSRFFLCKCECGKVIWK